MKKQKLDLSAYQIRTDLAVETKEILEQENDPNVVKRTVFKELLRRRRKSTASASALWRLRQKEKS
ncbi:hypothetical protein OE903_02145 [Bacillus sp. B6(2022)]|nr:hypothetical protein [Bacillus sp. B6(2022)]